MIDLISRPPYKSPDNCGFLSGNGFRLTSRVIGALATLSFLLAGTPPTLAANDRERLPGVMGHDDRTPLDTQEWPWAAIGRVNRSTGGFCTGTLIGPRQVLT